MPGSSQVGNEQVIEMIGELDIESILDVGPGRGQWYDLLHTFFPTAFFDGVEIFEPYVERYHLMERYSFVWIEDAREFKPPDPYDLVIFGDVLEHMQDSEAIHMVNRLLSKWAIISIPIGVCPQEPTEENPYEEHVSTWYTADVLSSFPQIITYIVKDDPLTGDGIGRGIFLLGAPE